MRRHFDNREQWGQRQKGDKIWLGIALAIVGVVLMLKKLDMFYFDWHAFWPFILIAIGIGVGIKKKFRNHFWWILILIGVAHLVPEFTIGNTSSSSLMAPLALIIGGILIATRSRKNKYCEKPMEVITNNESTLNVDVTFGGRKEIITSKEFRGGLVSTTFGGVEINMIQADSSIQPMIINVKVSFGGVELIVPPHWEVQNEIAPTFGSVEDQRAMRLPNSIAEEKKILILKGSCNFGSVEIKSY